MAHNGDEGAAPMSEDEAPDSEDYELQLALAMSMAEVGRGDIP